MACFASEHIYVAVKVMTWLPYISQDTLFASVGDGFTAIPKEPQIYELLNGLNFKRLHRSSTSRHRDDVNRSAQALLQIRAEHSERIMSSCVKDDAGRQAYIGRNAEDEPACVKVNQPCARDSDAPDQPDLRHCG